MPVGEFQRGILARHSTALIHRQVQHLRELRRGGKSMRFREGPMSERGASGRGRRDGSDSAKKKRIFVFDLDGPILDVSERYYRIYRDLVQKLGGTALSKAYYWESKRRQIPEEVILATAGVGEFAVEYAKLRTERLEDPTYLQFDRLQEGIVTVLEELARKEILGLVTMRARRDSLERQLQDLQIRSFFHFVTPVAADGMRDKTEAIRRVIGNEPMSGWVVGDSKRDVMAGKALKFRTLAVTYGIRSAAILQALQPTEIVDSPASLVAWAQREKYLC